jgi:hypothetical protein
MPWSATLPGAQLNLPRGKDDQIFVDLLVLLVKISFICVLGIARVSGNLPFTGCYLSSQTVKDRQHLVVHHAYPYISIPEKMDKTRAGVTSAKVLDAIPKESLDVTSFL